jgi:hypothetical protein
MRRHGLAVAVTVALVACTKDQPLQAPPRPSYMISDAAHAGTHHFFFLPPLVPDPSAFFQAGAFDPSLSPTVEVCRLHDDPGAVPGTDCQLDTHGHAVLVFGPVPMTLDLAGQQYTRNWDTSSPTLLDPSGFFRIIVRGAPATGRLGFVDVDPVSGGVKNVRTGDVVQFQDGRTLPIKVRIEQGATNPDHVDQVVGNVATIVTTNTGFAGASFPDNWLPQGAVNAGITAVLLSIERIPVGAGTNDPTCFQSGRVGYEGCYRFRTDPDLHQFGTFTNPVIVGVCIQRPDFVRTDEPVEMYRQEEGVPEPALVELPSAAAPFLTCNGFMPTQVGSLRAGGLFGLARAGWNAIGREITSLVMPRPLYAVDLGAGGSTDGMSRFGWLHTPFPPPTLINCTGDPGGDETFRGFYLPNYPGTILDQVTMHFSSTTAGTYTIALTARSGAYDGPIVAFDSEFVTLTADKLANVTTTFSFPSAPVTAGSTLAFTLQSINGPSGGIVYYSVPSNGDPNCPVTETENTVAPLSTFRRQGVNVQIQGASPIPIIP